MINIFFRKHIFISLCAVSFFWTGYLLEGGDGNPGLARISIIFVATFLVYHFNAIGAGIVRRFVAKSPAGKKHRFDFLIYAFLALSVLVLGLFISWGERLVLLAMALLSLLYNPPVGQRSFPLPLRSVPFLKIFLISIVWAMLGSLYPWSVLGFGQGEDHVWRLFTGMFFFILGITLPFDVRDREHDRSGGLSTVVHLFDVRTTRLLGIVFLVLAGALLGPLFPVQIYLVMVLGIAAALVYGTRPDRPFWYFQGLLDGTIPLLYLATVLSLNMHGIVE